MKETNAYVMSRLSSPHDQVQAAERLAVLWLGVPQQGGLLWHGGLQVQGQRAGAGQSAESQGQPGGHTWAIV